MRSQKQKSHTVSSVELGLFQGYQLTCGGVGVDTQVLVHVLFFSYRDMWLGDAKDGKGQTMG